MKNSKGKEVKVIKAWALVGKDTLEISHANMETIWESFHIYKSRTYARAVSKSYTPSRKVVYVLITPLKPHKHGKKA